MTTQVHAAEFSVYEMLPPLRLLWSWLNQFPDNNFDDFGPKSFQQLDQSLHKKHKAGVEFRSVYVAGEYVGCYGLLLADSGVAYFSGVCFDKAVHGKGIASTAIEGTLRKYFQERGCRKVVAEFFAHNARIERFFARMGGYVEGTFAAETLQHGKPVTVRRIAILPGTIPGERN